MIANSVMARVSCRGTACDTDSARSSRLILDLKFTPTSSHIRAISNDHRTRQRRLYRCRQRHIHRTSERVRGAYVTGAAADEPPTIPGPVLLSAGYVRVQQWVARVDDAAGRHQIRQPLACFGHRLTFQFETVRAGPQDGCESGPWSGWEPGGDARLYLVEKGADLRPRLAGGPPRGGDLTADPAVVLLGGHRKRDMLTIRRDVHARDHPIAKAVHVAGRVSAVAPRGQVDRLV